MLETSFDDALRPAAIDLPGTATWVRLRPRSVDAIRAAAICDHFLVPREPVEMPFKAVVWIRGEVVRADGRQGQARNQLEDT